MLCVEIPRFRQSVGHFVSSMPVSSSAFMFTTATAARKRPEALTTSGNWDAHGTLPSRRLLVRVGFLGPGPEEVGS